MSNAIEFPQPPEGTQRVRAIIWIDANSACAVHERLYRKRRRGCVRVFADIGPRREPRLLWEGAFREEQDPRLRAEREAAARFYGAA